VTRTPTAQPEPPLEAHSGPAVRTRGLTRRFKRQTALDDVDLEVQPGEIFGLVGPNGAGKTTLLRLLCAILRPSRGRAWVLGHDVATDPGAVQREIGYMSQAFSLYQELTVAENLRFYGDIYGGVPASRQHEVCSTVGLSTADLATLVAELPTGVRQRAALAAAALHGPQLLFLDEPTSGVDPAGRRDFWALMHRLAADGTTILVSTHVMTEAERCDRVALMAAGKVLAVGSPASLRAATGIAVAVVDAEPWQRVYEEAKTRWPAVTLHGQSVHVPIEGSADPEVLLAPALAGARVRSLRLVEPTFEDAFVWYIRSTTRTGSSLRR